MKVRFLVDGDRAAWKTLWRGYQEFYEVEIPPEVTELTWRRFLDPHEPMWAHGAFAGEELIGMVHYIFHRTCWAEGRDCYLQDLFTSAEHRAGGVGRALIESVYSAAQEAGCGRVHWLTHETNARAMLLYDKVAERSGFVEYERRIVASATGVT